MTGSAAVGCAAFLAAAAAALWTAGTPVRTGASHPGRSRPRTGRLRRALPGRRPAVPVQALLTALAAELATGQPTAAALDQAGRDLLPDPCPAARRAARAGGDIAEALREDAAALATPALRNLAACWEVAEHSGAGLALAVGRLADSVRATENARAQLAAEVAAARASAHLLAVLPLFGMVIGQWIGAHPLDWLLGTWVGGLVLVAGLGLELLGMLWLNRLVSAVEDSL